MTYATAIANDRNAVITAIRDFLQAQGWTIDYYGVEAASYLRLHAHKADVYLNFTSSGTYLFHYYMSSGFAGSGTAWNLQTAPRSSVMSMLEASPTYPATLHMFDYTVPVQFGIAIDYSNAYSEVMMAGKGVHVDGNDLRVISGYGLPIQGIQYNALFGRNGQFCNISIDGAAFDTDGPFVYSPYYGVADINTAVAPLVPIHMWLRPASNYQYIGTYPNVRGIAQGGVLAQGDEITYGSDVWKVFATRSKPSAYMAAFKKN